jgi:D-3-phosphoglycerate dehydrogenase / 2-oxoglutarate reductase
MKIVGIGDLLIPAEYIKTGFQELEKQGHQVETIQWQLKDYEELQNINLKVETEGSESVEPSDEVIAAVKDADVIITQFCPITKKLIDACDSLKVVGVLRGGYENVNVEYAKEKGILLYHTPGRNSNAVADFTVGMMLAECRNIAKSHCHLKKGEWVRDYANKDTVPDLPYKTVGIVGFGEIGRKVAQRLRGFEMEILTYDPYVKDVPDYVTKLDSLEELAGRVDFLTLHMRMTEETEHIINADILSRMKPSAYLINTARSGLVDEKALYEALKSGKIVGAALDVFDEEPPAADYPLVAIDNVTITPHLAGGTVDAFTNSPRLLAAEMLGLTEGKPSRYIINPEILEEVSKKLS